MRVYEEEFKAVEQRIKFLKCFRDDESKKELAECKQVLNVLLTMEASMSTVSNTNASMFSNDLVVRKYQYQQYIMEHGTYTWADVVDMDMRALRMAVDELLPVVITSTSVTTCGGKTKKVTVVRAG